MSSHTGELVGWVVSNLYSHICSKFNLKQLNLLIRQCVTAFCTCTFFVFQNYPAVAVNVFGSLQSVDCWSCLCLVTHFLLFTLKFSVKPNINFCYSLIYSNLSCRWLIRVDNLFEVVRIKVLASSLDDHSTCNEDYVEVRDGLFFTQFFFNSSPDFLELLR